MIDERIEKFRFDRLRRGCVESLSKFAEVLVYLESRYTEELYMDDSEAYSVMIEGLEILAVALSEGVS